MHSIKPKGLSLGLGFQFFEYLGFVFRFGHFANLLQISNELLKNQKKILNFWVWISTNLKNEKKIKIDTPAHTQKFKFFFLYFKLSNSKFEKDLQNT